MIRAGLAMTITMEVWPSAKYLLATLLSLLNGVFTGFVPGATALVGTQISLERLWGPYLQELLWRTLTGPFVGGFIAEILAFAMSFIGRRFHLAAILTIFFIKEDFK